ncbi:MAG: hypothetical protein IPL61_21535 [Myxococcales bacterium]|nr:hypothetical protein [Myxococcales bacterium]
MNAMYLVAPIAIIGVIAYSMIMVRRTRAHVSAVGAEQALTDTYGAAFELAPGELLRNLWMGQLYTGPAVPEFHDSVGDKAGRLAKQAGAALLGAKLRYVAIQVHVAATTQGRLVVARTGTEGGDDLGLRPHSGWALGQPGVAFAPELGLDVGGPPAFDNGYRGEVGFVMFGTAPGQRLPVWLPADGIAAIAAWRGAAA